MKWYGYVIIALVVGGYTWLHFASEKATRERYKSEADSAAFKDLRKIMVLKAQSEIRAEEEKRRLMADNQRVVDSTTQVNARLLTENKRLRGLIRPVPVVMAGDTAEMRAQLTYRDQAIENCDSSLLVKGAELAQAKAYHDSIQAIEARRNSVQDKAITALNSAAWDNAARAEKAERKLDNPWSFGLHAGYGATLAAGQFYAGPQVGGGVQYKIRLRRRR